MKGFTIIELIIVVSLVGILTGVATPFLSAFILRDNWHVASDRIVSELRKAQAYAMDGKTVAGSNVWGVCMIGNTFRLFNGNCNSPNQNEDYLIPNGVSITGLTTLTFGNLRGEPSTTSFLNISTNLGTTTITLNAAGMIQSN
ncbi:MAG TPA: prepilin-type N-terminal cleavage/methylation domain-containing protein [Patescibacteria group bacterium]